MIPGRTLHRMASLICTPATLERVVEPAIADLQKEFATPAGAIERAWVLVLGYLSIIKVIAICAVSVSPATDEERRTIVRMYVWCVSAVLGMTALLMVPPFYSFAHEIRGWSAATALVPQAAPLAIPVGIAFGLAFGFSVRPTSAMVKAILVATVAASALSFYALVWAMPAGNQAFREIAFRALNKQHQGPVVLQKGYNEMTLSEMRDQAARLRTSGDNGHARDTAFRMHLRIALAGASLAFVCVFLVSRLNNRSWRALLAFGLAFAYWALIFIGESGMRRGYLPPLFGAWLPNLALISTAMLIALSRASSLDGSLRSVR